MTAEVEGITCELQEAQKVGVDDRARISNELEESERIMNYVIKSSRSVSQAMAHSVKEHNARILLVTREHDEEF